MTQTITPAERLRDLSDINAEVSLLLQSAGNAIDTLTGRQEASFETQVQDYYTRLQAIIARLRRQAIALEESGIIQADTSDDKTFMNGGLGNLDIGWLNSRGNSTAHEKENEIMKDMKKLLQDTLAGSERAITEPGRCVAPRCTSLQTATFALMDTL